MDASILLQYPICRAEETEKIFAQEFAKDNHKMIVLDDDPTGVQTVHDVSVYTDWDIPSIRRGFREREKLFYILTNSRSMTEAETRELHQTIASNIDFVSKEMHRPYLIISRSDSTLRGHYPLETEVLKDVFEHCNGIAIDGEIFCPYFKEGGRFTINSIHYVRCGEKLIPASETEFAKDRTFGYTNAYIPEYIEEKTNGRYGAEQVIRIPIKMLRSAAYDMIEEQLSTCRAFQKVCVDAIDDVDLKVFGIALFRAMRRGKRFLFRTAAGFVRVIGGIQERPLLTHEELSVACNPNGGIVVVGSHTEKTTRQLEALLTLENTVPIAFHSVLSLAGDQKAFEQEIQRCVKEEELAISQGKTAVCYTERTMLPTENQSKEEALKQSVAISQGVCKLISLLHIPPAFVVAKGGITSSDVGTKALQVRCARVMGQIVPGVPVWKLGKESRFPNTPYIIFPGNVGEKDSLKEVVLKLISSRENTGV